MLELSGLWISLYLSVGFMAVQSRNVNTGRYGWAVGTSVIIGILQVMAIRGIVSLPTIQALLVSCTAGPFGIVSAMKFSHHVIEKRSAKD